MLINVKCFGTGINEMMYLDVKGKSTVSDLIKLVRKKNPDIEVKRLLYAGKQLSDPNTPLESFDIYKECTIQLFGRKLKAEEAEELKMMDLEEATQSLKEDTPKKPSLRRMESDQELSYGEILLIHLIDGRNLVPMDLGGKSDPYVIFVFGSQSCRSSVIKKTLNPQWNELFGIFIPPRGHTVVRKKSGAISKIFKSGDSKEDNRISVLAFDHDYLTPDDPLGQFEILLDDIPRDHIVEKCFTLEGVEHGELMLSIRRSALTSPEMQKIAEKLIELRRPIGIADLEEHRISLNMLVGDEPFIRNGGLLPHADQNASANPAIANLESILAKGSLNLDNPASAVKIHKILSSQGLVNSLDLPSSHLWIGDCLIEEKLLFETMQEISLGSVKRFLYVPGKFGVSVFITFRNPVAALKSLIHLSKGGYSKIGFGRNVRPVDEEAQTIRCGFVMIDNIFEIKEIDPGDGLGSNQNDSSATWRVLWADLSMIHGSIFLRIFKTLQDVNPLFQIDTRNCLFLKTGPWTMELIDKSCKISYKVRTETPQEMTNWFLALKVIRDSSSTKSEDQELQVAELKDAFFDTINHVLIPCSVCKEQGILFDMYACDSAVDNATGEATALSHNACLVEMVASLMAGKQSNKITQQFSVHDLFDILPKKDFDEFLEITLQDLLLSRKGFVQCPKCSISIEHCIGDISDSLGEKLIGIDKRPVGTEPMKHYLANRIRCRTKGCFTDFCASCLESPYHTGYNCVEYQEYRESKKCRFCQYPVTEKTRLDSKEPAFANVCNRPECVGKSKYSCTKKLKCSHFCCGIADSTICPPCLDPCCDQREKNAPKYDDVCVICYNELGNAPYLVLSCIHSFHYVCFDARLKAGPSGSRIDFDFTRCPLCKSRAAHADFAVLIKSYREMEECVTDLAYERLVYEGLENDPQIVNKDGRFYKDPRGFAMDHYSFFKCYECKAPYFAGARECGPAGDDDEKVDEKELICPKCSQVESQKSCKVHGDSWIAYKCKYCCSVASFHCWSNCHFCVNCHKPGTWDKLAKHKTGANLKPIEQYQQCPGIREKMNEYIADNPHSSVEEREVIFASFISDPDRCPMKKRHPPAGIEFGLGCLMCADKSIEEKNAEAAKKALKEKAVAVQRMLKYYQELPEETKFKYKSDFDKNGIIYNLGSAGGLIEFLNPGLKDVRLVSVRSSILMGDSQPAHYWIGRTLVRCVTAQQMNSWFSVDFMDATVTPTHYTLRHYASWDTEALRNWVLEGSLDGNEWTTLSTHKNDSTLNKKGMFYTWKIRIQKPSRIFRLRLTGFNSNQHLYLACSGFELYGKLKKFDQLVDRKALIEKALKASKLSMDRGVSQRAIKMLNKDGLSLKFERENDSNGVLYFLGTQMGQKNWMNPAEQNLIKIYPSSLAPNSEPATAVAGREAVRCVTRNIPNSFFIIDLKTASVIPNYYSLRHYSSWDVEALRHWVIEGSVDGKKFTILRNHVDDETLRQKGQVAAWKIDSSQQRYRLFRIRQTGLNSNKHNYLALSGFEIYGQLFPLQDEDEKGPPVPVQMRRVAKPVVEQKEEKVQEAIPQEQAITFKPKAPMDDNGILFFLGTAMGAMPYVNPAQIDAVRCVSSPLNHDSVPIEAFAGRECVRLVSKPVENSWFMIDFKDKLVCPTHYTLRHYSSWDTEALRYWVLEGSLNGIDFHVIMEHKNDKHLKRKGQAITWQLPKVKSKFKAFRIRITGKNSNNHMYLCCTGFEVYGTLFFSG